MGGGGGGAVGGAGAECAGEDRHAVATARVVSGAGAAGAVVGVGAALEHRYTCFKKNVLF